MVSTWVTNYICQKISLSYAQIYKGALEVLFFPYIFNFYSHIKICKSNKDDKNSNMWHWAKCKRGKSKLENTELGGWGLCFQSTYMHVYEF